MSTKEVRYVGPHTDGVTVGDQFVAHGDTIEVPAEVADGLLEQDGWETVGKKKTPKGTN